MPPVRILFAIGSLDVGGAERQVIRYLHGLDRKRFTPGLYLIARRGDLLGEVPSDVPVFAFEERLGSGKLYFPGRIHRRQVLDLAAMLDEFSAELLVTRTFHQTLVAGRAVRKRPTPFIAIEASDPRQDFPRQVRRFAAVKKYMIAAAYRRATAVVALSEGARQGLCSFYGLPQDRVLVVPNFVNLEEIDRLASEPCEAFPDGQFHVSFVGRLSTEKGPDLLLEAAQILLETNRVPNLQLHLVGNGPLRAELEEQSRSPPLRGHVVFHGFRANPYPFLKNASLFCLPSRQEGMPGALLEAMACGVPVVAADCQSGPREILAEGTFGRLVPTDDPIALAEAIEDAARERQTGSGTAAARKRIESKYSSHAVMECLQSLWERSTSGNVLDESDHGL